MESNEKLNPLPFAPPGGQRMTAALGRWISLESLLIAWFFLTPFASFYVRIPTDQSLLTFDRCVLAMVGVILLSQYGFVRGALRPAILATRFEVFWALLSALVLVSAIAQANNSGFALRLAVDAFALPLLAFHAARYHLRPGAGKRLLFFAAVALAVCLFVSGAYEYRTGVNLFAYKGSEIFRDGELRVNGPFLSDPSYAIICLLLTLFLRLLPQLFALKFDRGARLVYVLALGMSAAATLLPLFRTVAVTLALCWALVEALLLVPDRHRSSLSRPADRGPDGSAQNIIFRLLRSKRAGVYALAFLLLLAAFTAWQELSGGTSFARRLTSARNVYGRLATWQTAARIAMEKPLFGVGLTNYTDYFDRKFSDWREQRDALADTRAANTPHSNLLWMASEMGAAGLLLYVLAFVYLARLGYRLLRRPASARQRLAGGGVLVLLIAYTIPGLTLQSGAYWDLNLYFFFMLGLLSNQRLAEGS